jgi:hypothetical protein
MYSIITSVLSFLFIATLGLAAPAPVARPGSVEPYHLYRRQGTPTLVPQAEVDSFNPGAHFAAASFCDLGLTQTWTCGKHCDATPGFVTSLVGGDGGDTPKCELSMSMSNSVLQTHYHHITTRIIIDSPWASLVYVGFDPTSNSVVVAHQGTDPSKIESLLVDADFVPDPVDQETFPGLPSNAMVHGGFQDAHARSAPQILQAVQDELTKRNIENVLVVGHSLGGALALLDGVSLGLKLPSTTQLRVITYGMPRVSHNHHGYQ